MKNETSLFNTLSGISVNDKTEKKSGLTYLSWAFAWAEFKKTCPTATYKVKEYGEDKKPYLNDPDMGIMVMTEVTVNNQTHEMWLFVMDGANKAMKTKPYTYKVKDWNESRNQNKEVFKEKTCNGATMFDINKTLMRCLVKNLAMFGLGIYIYAGEDLPENYIEPKPKANNLIFKKCLEAIKNGKTTEDAITNHYDLKAEQLESLNKFMIELEEKLEAKINEEKTKLSGLEEKLQDKINESKTK